MHQLSNQYGSTRCVTPPSSVCYPQQPTLANIQHHQQQRMSHPSHSVSMAMTHGNGSTGPNPVTAPSVPASYNSCVARDSSMSTGLQRFSSTLSYPNGYNTNNNIGSNYTARGSITGRDTGGSEFYSTMARWQSRLQQEAAQLQALDMEEAKLNAEEASLKEQLNETHNQHRLIDQHFLLLQQDSNEMLIRERRWYMEPIPDRKEEILQRGYKVEVAQAALESSHQRLSALEEELASLQHVVDHKKRQEQALLDLEHRFSAVEARRRKMIIAADKHFNRESERVSVLTSSVAELEPLVVAFCPAMGPGGDMYYGDNNTTKHKRRRPSLGVIKDGVGGEDAAFSVNRDKDVSRRLPSRGPSQVLSTIDPNIIMGSSLGEGGGKQRISQSNPTVSQQAQTRSFSKRSISTSNTTDANINLIGRKAAQYLKEKKEKESVLQQKASANSVSFSFSNSQPGTSDSIHSRISTRRGGSLNEARNITISSAEVNSNAEESYIPAHLRSISMDHYHIRNHSAPSLSMHSEQSNTTTSARGTKAHQGVELELSSNGQEFAPGARVSAVLGTEEFDETTVNKQYNNNNKPARWEEDNGLDEGHSFCLGLDDDSTANSMVFSLVPPSCY